MAESCGKHMLAASGNETFHRAKLKRNSSIELLRIISMFMILAHHFVVHNASAYKALPVGICRFVVQFLFVPGGKIGVVIFFTISAWFFLEHDQTLKGCVRRIWFLEKEVFFYSILLMMGTAVVILDQEKVTRRTACTAQSSASWQSRPTSSST